MSKRERKPRRRRQREIRALDERIQCRKRELEELTEQLRKKRRVSTPLDLRAPEVIYRDAIGRNLREQADVDTIHVYRRSDDAGFRTELFSLCKRRLAERSTGYANYTEDWEAAWHAFLRVSSRPGAGRTRERDLLGRFAKGRLRTKIAYSSKDMALIANLSEQDIDDLFEKYFYKTKGVFESKPACLVQRLRRGGLWGQHVSRRLYEAGPGDAPVTLAGVRISQDVFRHILEFVDSGYYIPYEHYYSRKRLMAGSPYENARVADWRGIGRIAMTSKVWLFWVYAMRRHCITVWYSARRIPMPILYSAVAIVLAGSFSAQELEFVLSRATPETLILNYNFASDVRLGAAIGRVRASTGHDFLFHCQHYSRRNGPDTLPNPKAHNWVRGNGRIREVLGLAGE